LIAVAVFSLLTLGSLSLVPHVSSESNRQKQPAKKNLPAIANKEIFSNNLSALHLPPS